MAKAGVNFLSQLGRKKLINHPQKNVVCISPQKCEVGKSLCCLAMTHMYIVRMLISLTRSMSESERKCLIWVKDIWHKNSIESNDMRVFPFRKNVFQRECERRKMSKIQGGIRSSYIYCQFYFSNLKNVAKILRVSRPFPPTPTIIVIIDVVVVRVSSPNC